MATLSQTLQDVIRQSHVDAMIAGEEQTDATHLLEALLRGSGTNATRLLVRFDIEVDEVGETGPHITPAGEAGPDVRHFTDLATTLIRLAHLEARTLGRESVGTEHLLLAFLRTESGDHGERLRRCGLAYRSVLQEAARLRPEH